MFNRLPATSAAQIICSVLIWGIITEIIIVALGLITHRSLPALLHLALLYLGSYAPLLFAAVRNTIFESRRS
jgi:hypothetical protein